ncbi:MAG: phosphatase PAP2 family protein [Planctomycetota bacterium]
MKTHWLNILVAAILLATVLAVFEFTDLDIAVQDHFYMGQRGAWLVDKDEPIARAILYDGFKVVFTVTGGACGVGFVASWWVRRLAPRRVAMLRVALAAALVPITVLCIKQFTNVYLPAQIERYGGDKPHIKLFHAGLSSVKDGRPGRGFPASHASAGFALMIFFYALPRRRWAALGVAVALGWVTALYQTLNGQHFLSHTFATWGIAWIVIQLIVLSTARLRPGEPSGKVQSLCSNR